MLTGAIWRKACLRVFQESLKTDRWIKRRLSTLKVSAYPHVEDFPCDVIRYVHDSFTSRELLSIDAPPIGTFL
jgi:hypothetical protein